MPDLVRFAVDRDDVTPYYEALTAALNGTGPALTPYDASLAAPTDVPADDLADAPHDLALVVSTSGSTGVPKRAMLTREALLASANATHDRIGGAGTWLLPLPPHHIAGTQVLVRSIVAGTTPIVLPAWSIEAFTKATTLVVRNAPPFSPVHTSLVPTQLTDVLADEAATAAARRYRSILVGGAAASPTLLRRAADAGLAVRTTYGSSETAGGCVYDGDPLAGVGVRILDPDAEGVGRIALTGPTLASGYLGDPSRSAETFVTVDGKRHFLTDDLGSFDGRLTVLGRRDDIITTGGYKVAPHLVETAVSGLTGVAEAVAVGHPDERWGEAVALAIVPTDPDAIQTDGPGTLYETVLDACRSALPPYAVPSLIMTLDRLPLKGVGKPDRAALATNDRWVRLR